MLDLRAVAEARMNAGRTVFSQLMEFVSPYEFQLCVDRYHGNRYVKDFSCWDQFLCMAFAQLTFRDSLRDIEACLRAQQSKLYHMGFRSSISRATLAHANQERDWRIYADFGQRLIHQARELYRDEPFAVDLSNSVYAFDSTTVDLCLSLFPWAQFRRHKSAVKIHTLLDLRGSIPINVYVTGGQVHDVNLLDHVVPESGAIYVFDRGYLDFARLFVLAQAGAFFITRSKKLPSITVANPMPSTNPLGYDPTKPSFSPVPKLHFAIRILSVAFTTTMSRKICASFFSPTNSSSPPLPLPSCIGLAGRWNYSSAGSNSIYALSAFTELRSTLSRLRCGLPSLCTRSWPSSASDSVSRSAFTKFSKF
jgi:hypothetical protein